MMRAAAVSDARIETPLSAVMTSPIISLDVKAPLSAAIDLLARVQISGIIVNEEARPIGVFTQLDALASRDLPRGTPLEETFDPAVICLPDDTKLHRAAAHAAQLDIRRVVVCRGRESVGVVSGLDFARVAGGALS
jgi:CBS domain-containing protein